MPNFNYPEDEYRFIGPILPFAGGLLIGGLLAPRPYYNNYPAPIYYQPVPYYANQAIPYYPQQVNPNQPTYQTNNVYYKTIPTGYSNNNPYYSTYTK